MKQRLTHRTLEMVQRALGYFPELQDAAITIGYTRKHLGSATVIYRKGELYRLIIRLRVRKVMYHTIGHELTHLVQGLAYGHRGGNHPVKDVSTQRVIITAQNHGFAVAGAEESIPGAPELEVTHVNLNDGTVEGLRHRSKAIFAVQYHPEAAPGPHDGRPLFNEFLETVRSHASGSDSNS
jgi:hypothetical protein